MTREERDRVLPQDPFPQTTSNTLVTRADLEADLKRSKTQGWYKALGESVAELEAVAAPLHFAGNDFAIAIAGPVNRFAPRHKDIARALIDAINHFETKLEKP